MLPTSDAFAIFINWKEKTYPLIFLNLSLDCCANTGNGDKAYVEENIVVASEQGPKLLGEPIAGEIIKNGAGNGKIPVFLVVKNEQTSLSTARFLFIWIFCQP